MRNKIKTKTNISDLFKQRGELEANMNVFSDTFAQDLTLIGFVPFNEFDLSFVYTPQINLNEDVIYTQYRIRLASLDLTLPVMKKIRLVKAENGEKFECQRKLITKYPIEIFKNYYCALENSDFEEKTKKNIMRQNVERVLKTSYKYDMGKNNLYEEDGKLFYRANAKEIVFTRTHGEYTVISNEFSCLCAYVNSVTGKPAYALFSVEDLFEIDSDKNE